MTSPADLPAAPPAPAKPPAPARATAAELEAALREARAAESGQKIIRLKVNAPHSELHHANVVIYDTFTPVPASLVAALQQAALDAGVDLEQEEV